MEITIQSLSVLLGIFLLCLGTRLLPFPKVRQWLLLLSSYLFYAHWEAGFLLVLVASSLMNYVWGSVLRHRPTALCLWIGITLNLLLLSFFKYLPSLLAAGTQGSWQPELLRQIVMPVGISFWTFQGLSYLFDIYREEELDPSLLEFCLYMAFWPTVLSGPVCRLPRMLPQFRQVSAFNWNDISTGMLRLIQGLIMKFVLAQILGTGLSPGEGVAAGFDQIKGGWGAIDVWLLSIGFGFQIFFDFAGYSHMVIGAARLFGIRVEENFDRPYLSTTPSVFWTRWHMSLSFWIRDYVFLPLAAMRRDRWWPYLALVLSMALFGLWHAAKATFILWGIYHGLLLVMHRLGQQMKRRSNFTCPPYLGVLISWATTFSLVSLGWILFRARDLDQALTMLRSVLLPSHYHQLALSANFYTLVSFVAAGYFAYGVMELIFLRYRAIYREKLSSNVRAVTRARPSVIAVELVEFFADRMWWWKTPIFLSLLVLGGIIVFARTSATETFIYTLF
jgi:alginate O-acetyltransferase complex protein AlgI